jgi:hypothetical protein
VDAWVKNDHLGFEIVYTFDGIVRKYRPDFLARLRTGTMLVLEVKGQDSPQNQAKRDARRARRVGTGSDRAWRLRPVDVGGIPNAIGCGRHRPRGGALAVSVWSRGAQRLRDHPQQVRAVALELLRADPVRVRQLAEGPRTKVRDVAERAVAGDDVRRHGGGARERQPMTA